MAMQSVAHAALAPIPAAWHVTREGAEVASVSVGEEGGGVVVEAKVQGRQGNSPFRFDTLAAADAFLRDLLASFAYLGCDVAAQ